MSWIDISPSLTRRLITSFEQANIRVPILNNQGPTNVNRISEILAIAQSTVAINTHMLEAAALVESELVKASKDQQKICSASFDEIVIRLDCVPPDIEDDAVEVSMPLGLYTTCCVSAPCGLCSTRDVIGLLDVPDFFRDTMRMQAFLVWFGRGYLKYKFPNNAKILDREEQEGVCFLSLEDIFFVRACIFKEMKSLEGPEGSVASALGRRPKRS